MCPFSLWYYKRNSRKSIFYAGEVAEYVLSIINDFMVGGLIHVILIFIGRTDTWTNMSSWPKLTLHDHRSLTSNWQYWSSKNVSIDLQRSCNCIFAWMKPLWGLAIGHHYMALHLAVGNSLLIPLDPVHWYMYQRKVNFKDI